MARGFWKKKTEIKKFMSWLTKELKSHGYEGIYFSYKHRQPSYYDIRLGTYHKKTGDKRFTVEFSIAGSEFAKIKKIYEYRDAILEGFEEVK